MAKAASPTSQRARDRHQGILDEALLLVGEKGYYGFSLQELAERCELTKAGLLHYVGSKEQLLLALLEQRDATNERAVLELAGQEISVSPPGESRGERLLRALKTVVATNADRPELTRLQVVLRAEAINPGHPAHGYFVSREASKQALLAEALEGVVAQPASRARSIIALMSGLEEEWLREGCAFDLVAESAAALKQLLA